MRTFSREVESRLDKVYKQGAGKKYGYEEITQQSLLEVQEKMGSGSGGFDSRESRHEDRMLSKI